MADNIQEYRSERIVVTYDPAICQHAARCVNGLPAVFNGAAKPWIAPEKADPEEISAVIDTCPSGALKYRLAEAAPS